MNVMKVSATNADRRDVERMYNRRTIRQLQQLAPFVSSCRLQSSVSRVLLWTVLYSSLCSWWSEGFSVQLRVVSPVCWTWPCLDLSLSILLSVAGCQYICLSMTVSLSLCLCLSLSGRLSQTLYYIHSLSSSNSAIENVAATRSVYQYAYTFIRRLLEMFDVNSANCRIIQHNEIRLRFANRQYSQERRCWDCKYFGA